MEAGESAGAVAVAEQETLGSSDEQVFDVGFEDEASAEDETNPGSLFELQDGRWMATVETLEGATLQIELLEHDPELQASVLGLEVGSEPIVNSAQGLNLAGEPVTFTMSYERTDAGIVATPNEIPVVVEPASESPAPVEGIFSKPKPAPESQPATPAERPLPEAPKIPKPATAVEMPFKKKWWEPVVVAPTPPEPATLVDFLEQAARTEPPKPPVVKEATPKPVTPEIKAPEVVTPDIKPPAPKTPEAKPLAVETKIESAPVAITAEAPIKPAQTEVPKPSPAASPESGGGKTVTLEMANIAPAVESAQIKPASEASSKSVSETAPAKPVAIEQVRPITLEQTKPFQSENVVAPVAVANEIKATPPIEIPREIPEAAKTEAARPETKATEAQTATQTVVATSAEVHVMPAQSIETPAVEAAPAAQIIEAAQVAPAEPSEASTATIPAAKTETAPAIMKAGETVSFRAETPAPAIAEKAATPVTEKVALTESVNEAVTEDVTMVVESLSDEAIPDEATTAQEAPAVTIATPVATKVTAYQPTRTIHEMPTQASQTPETVQSEEPADVDAHVVKATTITAASYNTHATVHADDSSQEIHDDGIQINTTLTEPSETRRQSTRRHTQRMTVGPEPQTAPLKPIDSPIESQPVTAYSVEQPVYSTPDTKAPAEILKPTAEIVSQQIEPPIAMPIEKPVQTIRASETDQPEETDNSETPVVKTTLTTTTPYNTQTVGSQVALQKQSIPAETPNITEEPLVPLVIAEIPTPTEGGITSVTTETKTALPELAEPTSADIASWLLDFGGHPGANNTIPSQSGPIYEMLKPIPVNTFATATPPTDDDYDISFEIESTEKRRPVRHAKTARSTTA